MLIAGYIPTSALMVKNIELLVFHECNQCAWPADDHCRDKKQQIFFDCSAPTCTLTRLLRSLSSLDTSPHFFMSELSTSTVAERWKNNPVVGALMGCL